MNNIDFNNKNLLFLFEWDGEKIYITQTLVSTWAVMAALMVFAVIVRIMLPRFKEVPSGFQNFIESAVEAMDKFTVSTMGEELRAFGGYFFAIFTFILISNYSSLIGLRPPTADLATTLALSSCTFIISMGVGIVKQKGNFIKSFFSPMPLFLPLNLIGEFSKPLSLGFRLFGNMLGGYILISLAYYMLPPQVIFVLPDILHAYFDIFSGALQAFIFTVLSMTFIQQKAVLD